MIRRGRFLPDNLRSDINIIGIPLTSICNAEYTDPRQRQLFKNIVCAGALSALLDMDFAEIEKLIGEQYRGKEKLIPPNMHALHLGPRLCALRILAVPIGLRLKRSDKVGDRILIEGNAARLLARSMAARRSAPGIRHAVIVGRRILHVLLHQASQGAGDRQGALRHRAGEDEIASIGMWWVPPGTAPAPSPQPPVRHLADAGILGFAYFAKFPR